jgi:putative glutamine amidotransferase
MRAPGNRPYQYLSTAYATAVEAAGGMPLFLPLQGAARALVERIDGMLIPGGNDFLPPRSYPDAVRFDPVAPAQLDFDRALLEAALERGRPLLGICYGMQLLALAHGGSLHYDIASDVPGALEHRPANDAVHAIAVEPDSRLAALLGRGACPVNTSHHQAVRDPGHGLRVCARASDGVVEAIESSGGFCIGVQWHPERSQSSEDAALLRSFVDACRS